MDDTEAKFTREQIEKECPPKLQDLGERIKALLDRAKTAEKKAENHYTSAAQCLAEAHAACDEGGFDAFKEKFCPDIGRSRAYELFAMGTGKKTHEEVKASTAARQRRHRAKKAKESVTVTDSFNKLLALLLQKIKKQQPKHFINTPHTADEFKQLATFFTNLAKLKQQSLDLKDAA